MEKNATYRVSLQLSTVKDLLDTLLVVVRAELVVETGLAGAVKNTVGAVSASAS